MNTQTPLLSDVETAEFLCMNSRRVRRLAKKGEIPSVQLPDGEIRFCEADVVEWVEAHKRPGNGACEPTKNAATSVPNTRRGETQN